MPRSSGGEVTIRKYKPGEEKLLYDVFFTSIHDNAAPYYDQAQLDAWAPAQFDETSWKDRIRGIDPFVIEDGSEILGYADLQSNGYIDHFFVKGRMNRKGIGQKLMNKILEEANAQGLSELTADVSLAAQQFFRNNGFEVVRRQTVVKKGVEIENAKMRRST